VTSPASYTFGELGCVSTPAHLIRNPGTDATRLTCFAFRVDNSDVKNEGRIMKRSTFRHLVSIAALLSISAGSRLCAQLAVPAAPPISNRQQLPAPSIPPSELSPEARQLQATIRERESAAEAFANQMRRELQEKGAADKKIATDRQRQLKEMLTAVFDLKLQLEELQVKELRSRLEHFEQLLRQRKERRDAIVERRTAELVERKELPWDSPETETENQMAVTGFGNPYLRPAQSGSMLGNGPPALSDINAAQKLLKVLAEHFPKSAMPSINCSTLVGGNILLTGEVADEQTVIQIMDIAGLYAPEVINHLRIKPAASATVAGQIAPYRKGATETATTDSGNVAQDPAASNANPETIADKVKKTDALPSLETVRERLAPFANQLTAAARRVREMEVPYLRNRSGVDELRNALEKLKIARSEFRLRFRDIEPMELNLTREAMIAKIAMQRAETNWEQAQLHAKSGNGGEAALKAALSHVEKAEKKNADAKKKLEDFQATLSKLNPYRVALDENDVPTHAAPISSPLPEYRWDVAQALIEDKLGTKVELVRCDDLDLWFKTALRVTRSGGGHTEGDLIVCLNGFLFNSWDQAARSLQDHPVLTDGQVGSTKDLTFLQEGLTGSPVIQRRSTNPNTKPAEPASINPRQALFKFEVQVRRDGNRESEMIYVSGACLSPQGFVVVPIPAQMLIEAQEIAVLYMHGMTARLIASDEKHGLALLKLESSDRQTVPWLKCRSKMPVKNQEVIAWELNLHGAQRHPSRVSSVGVPLPDLPTVDGGFVIDLGEGSEAQCDNGTSIVTQEGDLQGLTVKYQTQPSGGELPVVQYVVLPAAHIEKLFNDYLRTLEK
jgi:hypothetical protein